MKDPLPYVKLRSDGLSDQARETTAFPVHANGYGDGGDQIDLRQYWRTIRKHIWALLSVPLALVVIVGVRDLLAPPPRRPF